MSSEGRSGSREKIEKEVEKLSDQVITALIMPEKEEEMIELQDKISKCIRRDLSS